MTEEEIRLKKVEMRNLKNKKKRLPKVYHHRDFYRYYKDNCEGDVYPRLTYVNWVNVMQLMAQYATDEFLIAGKLDFPCNNGSIVINKFNAKRNGKGWKGNVDWNATLTLWAEDEECREEKRFIRFDKPTYYRIKYLRDKDCNSMTFIGCTRFKRAFKNLLNSGIYVPYYRKRQKTKL